MSKIAIKVENLSKIYRLGEIGTGTISRDMERWFKTKILKQEDPFLKIGETNERSSKGNSNIVYSLRDINFEIQQGDAVGIIGRNGAGKSTLLKILSRVTTPSSGRINIKGRVANLLEVGTGFHPDLTGRENIYLNGAILGMRRREIDQQLDEIIEFSGVERFIDTPVKRYSSGMYVRLAFAVSAHLRSEIIIVDEVLAVGDLDFQQKCLGKMNDLSQVSGRTLLFVSHNLAAINKLCSKSILFENGILKLQGRTGAVLTTYNNNENSYKKLEVDSNLVAITKCEISDLTEICGNIRLYIEINYPENLSKLMIGVAIKNEMDIKLSTCHFAINERMIIGVNRLIITIPFDLFRSAIYNLDLALFGAKHEIFEYLKDVVSINHFNELDQFIDYETKDVGFINLNYEIEFA